MVREQDQRTKAGVRSHLYILRNINQADTHSSIDRPSCQDQNIKGQRLSFPSSDHNRKVHHNKSRGRGPDYQRHKENARCYELNKTQPPSFPLVIGLDHAPTNQSHNSPDAFPATTMPRRLIRAIRPRRKSNSQASSTIFTNRSSPLPKVRISTLALNPKRGKPAKLARIWNGTVVIGQNDAFKYSPSLR